MNKTQILNHRQIEQKLNRIAWQIFEDNANEKAIIIAGINGNGYEIAKSITNLLEKISDIKVSLTELVINKEQPFSNDISVSLGVDDYKEKVVILIDDVLNSGKTMIYGVKHFLNVPLKKLNTAVLLDRQHNRFPIKADYVGTSLSTTIQEHITVELNETESVAYLS